MKKQSDCILILVLCAALLFVGCEKTSSNPLCSEPEQELDHIPMSNTAAQSSSTESDLDPYQSESDSVSMMEESSTSRADAHRATCVNGSTYSQVANYKGIVIRWGQVVGDRYDDDFPDYLRSVSSIKDLYMVNVEVLDVVGKHTHNDTECLMATDRVFLPKEALKYVSEGETSIAFLFTMNVSINESERTRIVYLDEFSVEDWPLPIFRYVDGRMVIDESQKSMYEGGNGYKMFFLRDAYRVNELLQEFGVDEKYYFRDGMTVDDLERFYDKGWHYDALHSELYGR